MIPGVEIPAQYLWPLVAAVILAVIGYVIQRALKNRTAPPTIPEMWARIERLEANQRESNIREQAALDQAAELKAFISGWIYRLIRWDHGGRKGRMPLPTDADLIRLNIHPSSIEGDNP